MSTKPTAQEQLLQKIKQALDKNQDMRLFIASVHDLVARTPEKMFETPYIQEVIAKLNRPLTTINTLLDLSNAIHSSHL